MLLKSKIGRFVIPIFKVSVTKFQGILYLRNYLAFNRYTDIQLDATFTKCLKSYLGVPKFSNNAIVHHLCETIPFSIYMKNRIQESISVLSYPKEFNGTKLSFLQDDDSTEDYNNYERIPSWFWLGPTYENLPLNKNYRKRLCSSLFASFK